MRYAPDKDDPMTTATGGDKGGKGGHARFMPGQINNLANALSDQSGASVKAEKAYLRGIYSPVQFGGFTYGKGGHGNGNGGGKDTGSNPHGPSDGETTVDPRPDVANPHGMMAPMTFPLGFQSAMGMQQPAMPQQRPSQAQLTPEMINLIRTQLMMRG